MRITIEADSNQELDHDSGIIYLIGRQEIFTAISTTRTDLDGGYLFNNLSTVHNYKVIANI